MSMQIAEAQQKLKSKLKRGDLTRIANALGTYRQYVYMVLVGKTDNADVWQKVAEIAQEHDEKEKALIAAAQKLS